MGVDGTVYHSHVGMNGAQYAETPLWIGEVLFDFGFECSHGLAGGRL